MKDVVSVNTMRESDLITIQNKTDSKTLMERAGKSVFDSVDWFGKVLVVCGKGNNGGDGFVLASLLKKHGIIVEILLIEEKFSADGKHFFELCKQQNVPYSLYTESFDFSKFNFIVDCILGTGFKGELTQPLKEVISKINNSFAQVISVDINSGLNGDNGLCELAVKSHLTISIGSFKTGHFLNNAKKYIKKIVNKDIGIDIVGERNNLVEGSDFVEIFKERDANANKGNFGYIGLIGGCTKYSGAIKLSNMAQSAMRSGCGVCKVICAKSLFPSISPHLLESTYFPLSDIDGNFIFDENEIKEALKNLKAVGIGMGLGENEENKKLLSFILKNYSLPIVIDADGLNSLSKMDNKILKESNCKIVLTPHLKEFERLCHIPIQEIKENPIKYAKEYAKENNVILLLKGSSTIVTDGNEVYLTNAGCVGMATAGSGDVLSGILTSLLGQEKNTLKATICSAFINGKAGEFAEQKSNSYSMIASDTINEIEKVITNIIKKV